MRGALLALMLAGAAADGQAPVPSTSPLPSDAEIRRILAERIDVQHQSVGIVAGVIDASGRRLVAYGSLAKGDARPLDGDTMFEIGSISKVFTSLLLADAVERGDVALGDPISKFLPDKVKAPQRNGKAITLEDLATHTSGLPRLPSNLHPKDPANPYADYSFEDLYHFLSGYELTRDIGAQYEYSNLGGGLLGHVLALRAHTDYETLVRTRITGPLGMASTTIALSPDQKRRLAVGHNPALQPVANWDLPTLAGAGALRSDANDMLTFLAANLGYTSTPLAAAMAAMTKVRRPTTIPNTTIGLGWHVTAAHGREIVWHNGGTAGYRTWAGYDPKARAGAVVLSNAGTGAGVDDIGRHLLDPDAPLLTPPAPAKTRTEIPLDAAALDRLVGRYQFAPGVYLTVTRREKQLSAQLTGQPAFEAFAESEKEFFLKVVEAQLTFEIGADGRATAVVLHQNGQNPRAARVE